MNSLGATMEETQGTYMYMWNDGGGGDGDDRKEQFLVKPPANFSLSNSDTIPLNFAYEVPHHSPMK